MLPSFKRKNYVYKDYVCSSQLSGVKKNNTKITNKKSRRNEQKRVQSYAIGNNDNNNLNKAINPRATGLRWGAGKGEVAAQASAQGAGVKGGARSFQLLPPESRELRAGWLGSLGGRHGASVGTAPRAYLNSALRFAGTAVHLMRGGRTAEGSQGDRSEPRSVRSLDGSPVPPTPAPQHTQSNLLGL